VISLSSPLAYTIALHLTKIILPRWCDCSRFDLHFPCKVCIQNYIQDEPKWVAYSRDADTDSSEQRKNYLQSLKGIPVAWSFIHARSDSEIALTSESKHSIDMLYNTCMSCRHFGISTRPLRKIESQWVLLYGSNCHASRRLGCIANLQLGHVSRGPGCQLSRTFLKMPIKTHNS